jgi:hypothetical protein
LAVGEFLEVEEFALRAMAKKAAPAERTEADHPSRDPFRAGVIVRRCRTLSAPQISWLGICFGARFASKPWLTIGT